MDIIIPRRIDFVGAGKAPLGLTTGSCSPESNVHLLEGLFGWKGSSFQPKGIKNAGNTCYLNSILQCLSCISPLANHSIGEKHRKLCKKSNSGLFCSFCCLEQHIKRSHDNTRGVIFPAGLVNNIRHISKSLRPGRQEDAHEFLRRLMESCSSVCKDIPENGKFLSSVFTGRFRSRISCTNCNRNSDTFDPFMDISLELSACNTLQDCLKKFTSVEVLQGANAYKCKGCDKKVTAKKQFSLDQLPAVLTFQMKRFDVFRGGAAKIHRKIGFPTVLDATPYSSDPCDSTLYELVGVVVHMGTTLTSGHYYAYCRSPAGSWLRLDDETVTHVKVETVLQESSGAYMLFYERKINRSEPPLSSSSSALTRPESPSVLEKIPEKAIEVSITKKDQCLKYHGKRQESQLAVSERFRVICKLLFSSRPLSTNRKLHRLFVMGFLTRRSLRKQNKTESPPEEPEPIMPETFTSSLDKSADERLKLSIEANTQWGAMEVGGWDEETEDRAAFREAQRQLQPLPASRSAYDRDYDRSSKLKHNLALPSAAKLHFDGARLFDHAASFKGKKGRSDRTARGRGRGRGRGRSRPF